MGAPIVTRNSVSVRQGPGGGVANELPWSAKFSYLAATRNYAAFAMCSRQGRETPIVTGAHMHRLDSH